MKFSNFMWKRLKEDLTKAGIRLTTDHISPSACSWQVFGLGAYITVNDGRNKETYEISENGTSMKGRKVDAVYNFISDFHPEIENLLEKEEG